MVEQAIIDKARKALEGVRLYLIPWEDITRYSAVIEAHSKEEALEKYYNLTYRELLSLSKKDDEEQMTDEDDVEEIGL